MWENPSGMSMAGCLTESMRGYIRRYMCELVKIEKLDNNSIICIYIYIYIYTYTGTIKSKIRIS